MNTLSISIKHKNYGNISVRYHLTEGRGQFLHAHQVEPKPSIDPPVPSIVRPFTFVIKIIVDLSPSHAFWVATAILP